MAGDRSLGRRARALLLGAAASVAGGLIGLVGVAPSLADGVAREPAPAPPPHARPSPSGAASAPEAPEAAGTALGAAVGAAVGYPFAQGSPRASGLGPPAALPARPPRPAPRAGAPAPGRPGGAPRGAPRKGSRAEARTISGDRTLIATLEGEVRAEGEVVQRLVAAGDRAEARAQRFAARLAAADRRLRHDRRAAARAAGQLSKAVVAAYVGSQDGGVAALLPTGSSGGGSVGAGVYAAAATDDLDQLVIDNRNAAHRVAVARVRVARDLSATRAALRRERAAQARAERAVEAEQSMLSSTRANLRALVLKAVEARAAEAEAVSRMLVKRSATSNLVVARAFREGFSAELGQAARALAASSYADPLRSVSDLVAERIDQGVDYCGLGPIYAIGDGIVLSTVNGGWPGGTYIAYQLTSGPAAGLVVYAAEDIDPRVRIGQAVNARTVIGNAYIGPNGFETGWANGAAGTTMAHLAGQFSGANSTAFGDDFSSLLAALGAPGGVMQQQSVTGSLPIGWPTW